MKILNFEQRLERAYSKYLEYAQPVFASKKGENFLFTKGWYVMENGSWSDLRYYSFIEFVYACAKIEEMHNLFLKSTEVLEKINIPEHVFSGIDKKSFLEYVENVFLKIENVDEIYIPAAVSFLKLKFMSGIIDIDSTVIMIKNQCRK